MFGGEEGIVDNNGDAMGVRGVPVVDVDEGSVLIDISEDEVENSDNNEETIDDGLTFSGSRNINIPKLLSCFVSSGSNQNMDIVPDPSSGLHFVTMADVAAAPTKTPSSTRVPRKSVGMMPSRREQADWWGGGGHFSVGGHS